MTETAVLATAGRIHIDGADRAGEPKRPPDVRGVVLFAHGSGGGRGGLDLVTGHAGAGFTTYLQGV